MHRSFVFVAMVPLGGCGSAVFYETERERTSAACEAAAPPGLSAATPRAAEPIEAEPVERASEIVRDDGFRGSLRQLIREPERRHESSDPACAEDLRVLQAEVSSAIELAVAHNDWPRERCLAVTGQQVGTLYHASMGMPFVDQKGRVLEIDTTCAAVDMARVARACAS